MHPLDLPGIRKLAQIAADGLKRHAEVLGQTIDGDLAVAADDLEHFWVAEGLAHAGFVLIVYVRFFSHAGE